MATKRKSKTYTLTWRGIPISIKHTPKYLGSADDHIEVSTTAKAPLPITNTGYLSHFIRADRLAAEGGPMLFVHAWLKREASTKRWIETEAKRQQLDFFALLSPPRPTRKRAA